MHLYMRAVGFSELDRKSEKKMIETAVNSAIDSNCILFNKEVERGGIVIALSQNLGIYVYGIYDGDRFEPEYWYPFLKSDKMHKIDLMTVERHSDKESFAINCDDLKAGVTLIFYLLDVNALYNYLNGKFDGIIKKDVAGNVLDEEALNRLTRYEIHDKNVSLSALSDAGMILLPVTKDSKHMQKHIQLVKKRNKLLEEARKGNESAIESLTIDDLNTYNRISKRIIKEDVLTIVDSSFMPCGIECDQYSVVGEILSIRTEVNILSGEEIYIMELDCNDLHIDLAVNAVDLVGEPKVGRRFKGQIWLQGNVIFE